MPPLPDREANPAGGRPRGFLWLAGAAWLALATAIGARLAGLAADDFYITYRYAQSFAAGRGLVFNPGERVFGVTEPAHALLLGLLRAATGVPVPQLGTIVTGISLLGIALLLAAEARSRGLLAEALFAGTLLVASSFLWVNQGAAAPTALLALVAAARAADRHPLGAGLLAGLAVWFRPDAALGVLILAALLWGEARRPPWRFLLGAGVAGAAGALLAGWWFGAVWPQTLAAKRSAATGEVMGSARWSFWPRMAPLLPRHFGRFWPGLLTVAALGQAALLARWGRAARLLSLFALALVPIYPLLGVPFFPWYAVPCVIAGLYGLAAVLGLVRAAPRLPPRLAAGLAALLALALGLLILIPGGRRIRGYEWPARFEASEQAGRWLRERTPAGSSVACLEVGVLGYTADRRVVDLLGLVTPASLPYVARGDLAGALLVQPTDYVALPERLGMQRAFASRWFRRAYAEVARFEDRKDNGRLILYARRPGSRLPPPRAR